MLKRSAGDLVTEANQSVTTLTADDPQSQAFRPEIGNAERLVLYCGSGGRSALAAKTLQEMGFDNVAHVAGGFPALKSAGAKIVGAETKSQSAARRFNSRPS